MLIIILLFFLFSLLQNSFFVHFDILGAAPNLVFVFFFLLSFFAKEDMPYSFIFFAITAGIFIDIFSYTYLGSSAVLFLVVGGLLKGVQSVLKSRDDSQPLVYFAPLFLVFFIIYEVLLSVYLRFIDPAQTLMIFDLKFVVAAVYNLAFALIGFFIFKKFGTGNVKKV